MTIEKGSRVIWAGKQDPRCAPGYNGTVLAVAEHDPNQIKVLWDERPAWMGQIHIRAQDQPQGGQVMGVYDIVEIGNRSGQVKCWGNGMTTVGYGMRVPMIQGEHTYSIAMREGGFLHIMHARFIGWLDVPQKGNPVFDKWGDLLTEESVGLLGEKYWFSEEPVYDAIAEGILNSWVSDDDS